MKKIRNLFLILTLVVLWIVMSPTQAEAATENDLTFELQSSGKEYWVTACASSASGRLEIPATYKGLPVTGIGDVCFAHCAELTSIIIPEGVTYVGVGVFSGCYNVAEISVPSSITYFGMSGLYMNPESVYSVYDNMYYLH